MAAFTAIPFWENVSAVLDKCALQHAPGTPSVPQKNVEKLPVVLRMIFLPEMPSAGNSEMTPALRTATAVTNAKPANAEQNFTAIILPTNASALDRNTARV